MQAAANPCAFASSQTRRASRRVLSGFKRVWSRYLANSAFVTASPLQGASPPLAWRRNRAPCRAGGGCHARGAAGSPGRCPRRRRPRTGRPRGRAPEARMPKPTHTGLSVRARICSIKAGLRAPRNARPSPRSATRITRNPEAILPTSAMRAAVEVGASRKIVSSPPASQVRFHCPRFLRRQIGHDRSVYARPRGIADEALGAVLQDGVHAPISTISTSSGRAPAAPRPESLAALCPHPARAGTTPGWSARQPAGPRTGCPAPRCPPRPPPASPPRRRCFRAGDLPP